MSASLILSANGNNGRQIGSLLAYRESLTGNGVIGIEFPFTRTTSGMERLSDGLWRDAAINLPRRYWDGTKYSYLFEPARTNLITFSDDYANVAWTKGDVTITSNSAIAPNGQLNADSFILAGTGTVSRFARAAPATSTSTTNTFSVFVKYVDKQFIQLVWNGAFSNDYANFDLINGTVTAGVYSSASIVNEGNGWWRISLTSTGVSTPIQSFIWAIDTNTAIRAANSTSTGTNSYLLWNSQLEAGSSATSPIITAGSAVLRAADAPALVGINNLITRTATLYWEINITAPINKGIVGLASLNSGLDFVRFRLNLTTIQNEWWVGGGFINQSSGSIVSLGINKIIFSFSENGTIKIFRNGVKDLEVAVGTLFTPTTLNLCSVSGAQQLINPLNEFKLWNTQLSDAECIALTL